MPTRNPDVWHETLARMPVHVDGNSRGLELRCGTGFTALRLGPGVMEYMASCDAAEMVAVTAERGQNVPNLRPLQARTGDGILPPGRYDAILAVNLMHLVTDLSTALIEAHGLLKPEGLLIGMTPCLRGVY